MNQDEQDIYNNKIYSKLKLLDSSADCPSQVQFEEKIEISKNYEAFYLEKDKLVVIKNYADPNPENKIEHPYFLILDLEKRTVF